MPVWIAIARACVLSLSASITDCALRASTYAATCGLWSARPRAVSFMPASLAASLWVLPFHTISSMARRSGARRRGGCAPSMAVMAFLLRVLVRGAELVIWPTMGARGLLGDARRRGAYTWLISSLSLLCIFCVSYVDAAQISLILRIHHTATPPGLARAISPEDEAMISDIMACPATPALAMFCAAAIWAVAYLAYDALASKPKRRR